ncbi:error-prone DNA polymerase [Mucilaginibacter polytrichastri]|uniref:Error-prone DNA polymerase n=1 Tax=Mucilaginibacter polytrichastri TaxID=1302689 RepID=A0A1Q6A3X6_9SPHI|nr:error-prone DNA polymerase [Mucilaginibacter polytrichastri]OKS88711.1 Error-prone DNA polymerase [Mucilaginibacter polytrichastri]SFT04729.1 error-prone DNA polymerase [Mucilaginibacter polytrichastri]
MSYAELQVTSNFSFRLGGSHPEELVDTAADLGYTAIALTDRNTFAGVVRAYVVAKDRGIKFIPAVQLDLLDGPSLLAYPTDQAAYSRLSGLLTIGNLRAEKEKCFLYKADVYKYSEGSIFVIIPPQSITAEFELPKKFKNEAAEYRQNLKNLYLAASRTFADGDAKRLFLLSELDVPLVATNNVHYHDPSRRELQDVLTCVRAKRTIFNAGYLLHQNAERYLKEAKEMERLFHAYPDAIVNTQKITDACNFDLKSLQYEYPDELVPEGMTADDYLAEVTFKGAHEFFGETLAPKLEKQLRFELDFVKRRGHAKYFLTVHDYVAWARSQKILCQGRGSAANSAMCYCLGITPVNPMKYRLLFSRFMSDDRPEPPDIDVDFEHERREEVMQYVFRRFGRDRAAILPTVTVLQSKGAIQDVGRAMGLQVDTVKKLSKAFGELADEHIDEETIIKLGLNPKERHLRKVIQLTGQLIGFPRQLGQHTGGFVITQGKLSDLCPVFHARMINRTNIEWNKDDIDALGFMKVDLLSLGMLTAIRKAFDLAKKHHGLDLTLANIPQDDPKVFEMVTAADTAGTFQVESRAQMVMAPQLRPKNFYDLAIQVALVRPGPIQGDMVHPYIRRRQGLEPVTYESDEIKAILERTLGIPLFQEQAMELAIVAAGFTPTEADLLRRSMATFKFNGLVTKFEHKLIGGMIARGYSREFAERIFKQLEGFGSYGFPESHAISFAHLVYVSCWIKCYYPDVFAAAILNSQPMGFYQPAQLVSDAYKHGVSLRNIDINHSEWDYTLKETKGKFCALRLGFRQVKGLREEDSHFLTAARTQAFTRMEQLAEAGVSQAGIVLLAKADAFRSIGLDRRQALWEAEALKDRPIGLFAGQASNSAYEPQLQLPLMQLSEHVLQDYATTGLSIKAHPLSFLRPQLQKLRALNTKQVKQAANGQYVRLAGIMLFCQRPGTAKGVCFITLEDEEDTCNLVVFKQNFKKFTKEILYSDVLCVEGRVQQEGGSTHLIVTKCYDYSRLLGQLTDDKAAEARQLKNSTAAKKVDPYADAYFDNAISAEDLKKPFPKSRNFK